MEQKKVISIICPVYNEQDNILLFYQRLTAVFVTLQEKYEWELIFTNNCSIDNTSQIIREITQQDLRVNLLTLSRNFGYQASILAGFYHARGNACVVIDVDCEDPPELIAQFIEYWEAGYDIVYGIRIKREEPEYMQLLRRFFYWILYNAGDNDVVMNMAEFALVSSEVRQHIINNRSTFPFLRTEIGYVGFKRHGIDYVRQSRQHGKTHYNFWGMTTFAIGGILSSSTLLLRLSAFSGGGLLLTNLMFLILILADVWTKAFQVIVMLDLMYLIFFLAIVSLYIARIYKNGVQRPIFIVDWKHSVYQNSTQERVLSDSNPRQM